MQKKTRNLLYFFIAGIIVLFIVFSAVQLEFLQGFLNKISGREMVEVKMSAEEESANIISGCDTNLYTDKKYNDFSINYGYLAKIIIQNFKFAENQNLSTCREYIEFLEKNGVLTWRTGNFDNEPVSRMEAARLTAKAYEEASKKDIEITSTVNITEFPSWNDISTWKAYSDFSRWNNVSKWNDWGQWKKWNTENNWNQISEFSNFKEFVESIYKLDSLGVLDLINKNNSANFYAQISASKKWAESLVKNTSNLLIK